MPTRADAKPTATTATGRRHHTLTLAQGRALRRELSRHTLHALGGERVCEESSPETTLESTQARGAGTRAPGVDGRGERDGDGRRNAARGARDAEGVERERRSTERRSSRHSIDGAGAKGEV